MCRNRNRARSVFVPGTEFRPPRIGDLSDLVVIVEELLELVREFRMGRKQFDSILRVAAGLCLQVLGDRALQSLLGFRGQQAFRLVHMSLHTC